MENREQIKQEHVTNPRIWECVGVFILFLLVLSVLLIEPLSGYLFKNPYQYRGEYLTKVILPVAAALVAIVGVILTIRRTNALEAQSDTNEQSINELRKQNLQQQSRFDKELEIHIRIQLETRFKNGIEHLGNENFNIALSGVYELHKLALEAEEYRERVFNILCLFVRQIAKRSVIADRNAGNDFDYDEWWCGLDFKKKKTTQALIIVQTIFDVLFKQKEGSAVYKKFKADFSNSNLQGINLVGIKFENVDFSYCCMHAASMYSRGGDSKETEFVNCIFHRAHLESANMSFSRFVKCDFSFASMCWANLYGCKLEEDNFSKADLSCVIVTDSVVVTSDFIDCCLDGAEIKDVHFKCVKDNEKSMFKNTSFVFASVFTVDWLNDKKTTFVEKINVTGVQTNISYYNGHTRIQRILEYGYNARTSGSIINNEHRPIDLSDNECYKKKKYKDLISKIIKYAIVNNVFEEINEADISALKEVKNKLS